MEEVHLDGTRKISGCYINKEDFDSNLVKLMDLFIKINPQI